MASGCLSSISGLNQSFESRTELRVLPVVSLLIVHCGGRVLGVLLLLTLPLQQKMGSQGLVSGLLESQISVLHDHSLPLCQFILWTRAGLQMLTTMHGFLPCPVIGLGFFWSLQGSSPFEDCPHTCRWVSCSATFLWSA